MSQEAATTNRPFISLSFIRRLLVWAATAVAVSLLLLIGVQQISALGIPLNRGRAGQPKTLRGPHRHLRVLGPTKLRSLDSFVSIWQSKSDRERR